MSGVIDYLDGHPQDESKREPQPGSPRVKHGSEAVKAKYGADFFREIGRKGGEVLSDRGAAYMSELGRKGGEATKARHGSEYYARIGHQGGLKRGLSRKP